MPGKHRSCCPLLRGRAASSLWTKEHLSQSREADSSLQIKHAQTQGSVYGLKQVLHLQAPVRGLTQSEVTEVLHKNHPILSDDWAAVSSPSDPSKGKEQSL